MFLLSVCLTFSVVCWAWPGCCSVAAARLAQRPVGYGDWQLHLPTNHPLRLADAGDRVYVATENAFYFLDKDLNTTQVLSRRDGLNDVGVAALAYDSVTQQTVLAYRNTNIDILQPNGSVRNLNDCCASRFRAIRPYTNHIDRQRQGLRVNYLWPGGD